MGGLRNELALLLLGTLFLAVLVYCYLGIFVLGLLNRRKALALSMVIGMDADYMAAVDTGGNAELSIKTGSGFNSGKNRFFRLPAILIRCVLTIETRDGRVIRHYADPGAAQYSSFPVRERGAYYSGLSSDDGFLIFDATGFFSLSLPMARREKLRLLALPLPAGERLALSINSGGTERRNEVRYRKKDEFTDQRPYVPGDDPRRINWKLYGHAPLGELFVREGDPLPASHARLLMLIDGEADNTLFGAEEARRAVDLLCENALSAGLEFLRQGIDITIGYTGSGPTGDKE